MGQDQSRHDQSLLSFSESERWTLKELANSLSSSSDASIPSDSLESHFTSHNTPPQLARALVLFLQNPTSTSSKRKLNFLIPMARIAAGVHSLVYGTSSDKARLVDVYSASPADFVTDLAATGLLFYEASAGCGGQSLQKLSQNPHQKQAKTAAVSSRLVAFVLSRQSKDQPESYSAIDLEQGLASNASLLALWNLAFSHLLLDPMHLVFAPSATALRHTHDATHPQYDAHISALRVSGLKRPRLSARSAILSLEDIWTLDHSVSADHRSRAWTCIYSSATSGKSWTNFTSAITDRGSTLVVIRDEAGHAFGGFASVEWNTCPKFYGDSKSFLFSLTPELDIFRPTGYNVRPSPTQLHPLIPPTINSLQQDHFQYLNHGLKSLPNGLGFGGQMDYWALWIDAGFETGCSKAHPRSTTYNSPRLSEEENFRIVDGKSLFVTILETSGLPPNRSC